jgi:putative transposase
VRRRLSPAVDAPYLRSVAHKLRDQQPGYHHIGARGNNKQRIFLSDQDRYLFLFLLTVAAKKHDWHILAYCLMRNHFHVVIRIGPAGMSRGMCELQTGYAVSFNKTHGRINHLFGSRYWSERATSDEHLMSVIRYVLRNPRRAGAKGPLESHRWTSYAATIGKKYALARFARDELLSLFGSSPARALRAFVSFCEDDSAAPPVPRQPPARKARERVT